ncbi:amidohydrolase family protein [Luedemannella flava]|uniref:Amidohydrolase family protein n=2 Tax=Luedemannella flava TaxID=349316 RepID=A0ABP4Y7L8_9ACTN
MTEKLRRALVPGKGLVDLDFVDGRVAGVAPADRQGAGGFDAGGRVVLPAFVDAHVHLDKAFLLGEAGAVTADLADAIATVARMRGTVPAATVAAGARRAVDALIAAGTTAARAHVEIDPAIGLRMVELHRDLAEHAGERLRLQLSAFPQRGLELPGMPQLLDAALAEGLDVVGGCPYVDRDPAAHLDLVFSLAERYGRPVDLHLDFTDDPAASLLGLVVERTLAHGMAGRVTIGHVTTLAAMAPDAQARAFDQLAGAGIALVVLPATDLYLTGHGEPGTRSLAPIDRAALAGVTVAIANNNLHNPFSPYGNGSLLQAAWLAGITRRLVTAADRAALLASITSGPAEILGLAPHGPDLGADAHLAIVDSTDPDGAILQAPTVLASLRAGRLTHRLTGL